MCRFTMHLWRFEVDKITRKVGISDEIQDKRKVDRYFEENCTKKKSIDKGDRSMLRCT